MTLGIALRFCSVADWARFSEGPNKRIGRAVEALQSAIFGAEHAHYITLSAELAASWLCTGLDVLLAAFSNAHRALGREEQTYVHDDAISFQGSQGRSGFTATSELCLCACHHTLAG